jgi:anti-sigma B factor antagonist
MVTADPARARLPFPRPAPTAAVVQPIHPRTALTAPGCGHAEVRTSGEDTDAATAGQRPSVLVDLSAVTFIDCAGMGPIRRAWRRALERGGRLTLVCSDPRTLRILRLTGLTPAVAVVPLTATALRQGA